MSIEKNLNQIKKGLPKGVSVVAVSKTKPKEDVMIAYNTGHRIFGENRVQELVEKQEALPKDIQWHMIGQLQTNKVKFIAPFVTLIQSVDSERLIAEIDKRAKANGRVIDVLIQVHIAREDSKSGFLFAEAFDIMKNNLFAKYKNVNIRGFMGMGTNTCIESVVEEEFGKLQNLFIQCQQFKSDFDILSMGMSNDYKLATKHGSNLIRLGSMIFGDRDYSTI